MRIQGKTRIIALLGVFIALSFILSYIDTVLSSSFAFVPGMKIGLAGIVTLVAFAFLKKRFIIIMLLARCLLTFAVFGSVTSLMFSLAGAFLSFCLMCISYGRISHIKTSVSGGVSHNIAQVLVAIFITGTPLVIWQMPYLMITGCISGFIMGFIVSLILPRITKVIK